MRSQERDKKIQHIPGRGWIYLQANHPGVPAKREDDPIAEMLVKSDKNPVFVDGFLEYLVIICPGLPDF